MIVPELGQLRHRWAYQVKREGVNNESHQANRNRDGESGTGDSASDSADRR